MEQRPPPSKSHASGITAIHWLPPWEPTYSAVQVAVTGRQSTAPRGVSSSLIREVSAEATPGRYQLRSSAAQPPNQEAPERPEGLSPPKSKSMPSCSGVEAVCTLYDNGESHFPEPACSKRSINTINTQLQKPWKRRLCVQQVTIQCNASQARCKWTPFSHLGL